MCLERGYHRYISGLEMVTDICTDPTRELLFPLIGGPQRICRCIYLFVNSQNQNSSQQDTFSELVVEVTPGKCSKSCS